MNPFFYDELLNLLPQSIFWKNTALTFEGCNQHFSRQFGFNTPKDLIGKTDYDLNISTELANKFRADDLEIIKTATPKVNYEEKSMTSSGEERIVLINKFPYFDRDHKVCGVLGIFTDITDLRLAESREKAAESEAMKSKIIADSEKELRKTVMVLVGDIVHDLRTPIATIRTASNNLHTLIPKLLKTIEPMENKNANEMNSLSKKEWHYLLNNSATTAINNAVIMMDNFINTTLSELDSAQVAHTGELSREDLTKCSSRRVLENALDAFTFPENISVNQNTSYDFYFMGNPILMIKIIFNILRNAVEQIQTHQHGDISLKTEEMDTFNIIKIRDTAGGAPPEVIDQIFDGYFSTKEEGTGVGLAFCKKMMLVFGGDISCDSKHGEWIEFILQFPKIK